MENLSKYTLCCLEDKGKEGSYGIVKKAIQLQTGKEVAIKFLKTGINQQGFSYSAIRQIAILKELEGHQNIVRLRETVIREKRLYLIFDFIQLNLREYLSSFALSRELIKSFMFEMISAVAFAHSRRIMHRDLKPQNILVKGGVFPKLPKIFVADWGIGRIFTCKKQIYTQNVVSFPYRAPEVILGAGEYTEQIDIWSLGCIFAEMITGNRLFQANDEMTQLIIIINTLELPKEINSPFLIKLNKLAQILGQNNSMIPTLKSRIGSLQESGFDLLKMMLELNPDKRITAKNALKHQYFQSKV